MCYDHIAAVWKLQSEDTKQLDRELMRQIRADRFLARKLQSEQPKVEGAPTDETSR